MATPRVKVKKKVGRKSKYHTNIEPYLDKIRMWRRENVNEEDIARTLKVNPSTWYTYKHKFPEFKEALQEEFDLILAKTEKSIYEKAHGYVQPQFKEIWVREQVGFDKETMKPIYDLVLKKREVLPDKIVLGDTNAAKFILTNMKPDRWADRKEFVDVSSFDKSVNLVNEIVKNVNKGDSNEES